MSARRRFPLLFIFAGAAIALQTNALASNKEIGPLPATELETLRNLHELNSEEKIQYSAFQLRKLLKTAREFSPALREGKYAVEAAEQDVNAAKGARLPQVTISGASTTYTGQIASSSRADGRLYGSVSATMPVYDFGRIDAGIKSRESAREATAARLDQQQNQVAIEAASTCLEYTKQRALLSAAQDYLESVKNLNDKLSKITEVDSGRKAELVQVRSRLLQAMQAKENSQSFVREFQTRLERLLGTNKEYLCEGIGFYLMQRLDIEKIRTNIRENAQVRSAQSDYEAAKHQLDQVSASRKPQFQASAVHAPVAAGIINDYYQSFSLNVSLPIYDGKVLQSTEKAAYERVNAAAERIELTVIQLDAEYRERFELATASQRRAKEYTSLLEVNDRVRKDFFVQWYSLGRRSLFELLAIEQEQYTLQQGYFTSLFDGMIGLVGILGNAGMLNLAD